MFKKLPEAESLVMQVVWDATEPIPTTDILRKTNERYKKSWTASTMQSLLNRLIARKFLIAKRLGKLKYYWALISKEDYQTAELEDYVAMQYGGSAFDLVANLCRAQPLSEEEIQKLRDLLK